jgi:predicted ArsR family transcriptional regulator
VEKNPAPDLHLGPRAGRGSGPLSDSRLRILERLRDQPEPVTQAALVVATGLHENTVREHLDGLLGRGLVRRFKATPTGRGRPAWLYEAIGEQTTSDYASLAAVLAATIAHTSDNPRQDAIQAGEEWGRELARSRTGGRVAAGASEARDDVVDLLAGLGFGPHADRQDASVIRLTRCPLLEAAHRTPQVVCAVHLGIVRGALEERGASPAGTSLTPFAEPGACLLVLPSITSRSSRARRPAGATGEDGTS